MIQSVGMLVHLNFLAFIFSGEKDGRSLNYSFVKFSLVLSQNCGLGWWQAICSHPIRHELVLIVLHDAHNSARSQLFNQS